MPSESVVFGEASYDGEHHRIANVSGAASCKQEETDSKCQLTHVTELQEGDLSQDECGKSNTCCSEPLVHADDTSQQEKQTCIPKSTAIPTDDDSVCVQGSTALEIKHVYIMTKIIELLHLFQIFGQKVSTLFPESKSKGNDFSDNVDHLDDVLEQMCTAARQAEVKSQQQQQKMPTAVGNNISSSSSSTLCARLRYYQKDSRGIRSSILTFQPKPEPNGLHKARVRLATLANCHCLTAKLRRQFAAAGWYIADQQPQQLICVFCKGSVTLAEAMEAVANSAENENGAATLHRVKFATCPWVLGMDVGNEPEMLTPADDNDAHEIQPTTLATECSESHDSEPAIAWSSSSNDVPLILKSSAPTVLVPPEVVRSACAPSILRNLQVLERSLPEDREATAVFHPMCHPSKSQLLNREATLANRPELHAPPHLLANAGFFADDVNTSLVRCYWCDLQLHICRDVAADLNPWIEHARWSPRCCHLLKELGAEFVLEARRLWPPTAAETWSESAAAAENDGDPRTFASSKLDFRIDIRQLRAREDAPAAATASRIAGAVDVKTALEERLRTTGDDFRSTQELLAAALNVRNQRRDLKMSAAEYRERRQGELEARRCVDAVPLADDDDGDWRACKVCMSRIINVTLLDCRHLCCCSNCAKSLDSCPVCRTPIRGTLLIKSD